MVIECTLLHNPIHLIPLDKWSIHQTIKALYKCGLYILFSSLPILLHQLAVQSLKHAAHIANDLHVLCWDNINIKILIFIEQRDSAPAKVQPEMFAILYQLNANSIDMQLSPMLAHVQQATDLTFVGDIQPTSEQCKALNSQLHMYIINILFNFSEAFEGFQHPNDPCLVHVNDCKMPEGHLQNKYPL